MKKYAYANIKIPIEIKENNQFEPLKDYIHIEFTPCYELPDKQTDYNGVLQNLNSLFTSNKINMNTDSDGMIKFKKIETQPKIEEEQCVPQKIDDQPKIEEEQSEPEEEPPQSEYFVLSNEIKPNKKPKLNLSFKKKTIRNTTAKHR
uniref:Uncharacterized protein n=1 Tax=viral metagenome TaxID=1070528 RepID=A0A6C0LNI7_9ZZZZ